MYFAQAKHMFNTKQYLTLCSYSAYMTDYVNFKKFLFQILGEYLVNNKTILQHRKCTGLHNILNTLYYVNCNTCSTYSSKWKLYSK
jgi:hypothetical protein